VSDRVAMGVYDALKERGLRIPEDVSVPSIDDSARSVLRNGFLGCRAFGGSRRGFGQIEETNC
jgi:Periplasmic binding protein-like domain